METELLSTAVAKEPNSYENVFNSQKAYFSSCIEAQSKEYADRVHFPALVCHTQQWSEETPHQSTLIQ